MGSVHICTRFSSPIDVPCVKINLTKSHITRKVGGRLTRKQTFNINELSFENWNTSKHVGHTPSSHGKFVSLSINFNIEVCCCWPSSFCFLGRANYNENFPFISLDSGVQKKCKEDEPEAGKWPIKHFNYMLFTCCWHLAFNSFIYYKQVRGKAINV